MFSGFFRDPLEFAHLPFDIDPMFTVSSRPFKAPIPPGRLANSKSGGTNKAPGTSTKLFKVMFDVKQFHPDDVTVTVKEEGTVVEVLAKHVEKPDEHGFISREFTRRHKLPSDVNPKKLRATMSYDGILVISVPYKVQESQDNERLVPLNLVNSSVAATGTVKTQKKTVKVPSTQKQKVEHTAPQEKTKTMG